MPVETMANNAPPDIMQICRCACGASGISVHGRILGLLTK
jgi:hypothetical protein